MDGRGLATKVTVGTAKDAAKPSARETFLYGPGRARYRKKSEWRVGEGEAAVLKSETTYIRRRARKAEARLHEPLALF